MGSDKVQTVQMVRIGMGEDEIVNPSNLLLPQKGSDHILSDVEPVLIKTAAIDQHLFAFGKFKEDGVPVSYIDKGEDELSLEMRPHRPKNRIGEKSDAYSDGQISKDFSPAVGPIRLLKVNHGEEERVEKNDF
jgi:hypothetical protein